MTQFLFNSIYQFDVTCQHVLYTISQLSINQMLLAFAVQMVSRLKYLFIFIFQRNSTDLFRTKCAAAATVFDCSNGAGRSIQYFLSISFIIVSHVNESIFI